MATLPVAPSNQYPTPPNLQSPIPLIQAMTRLESVFCHRGGVEFLQARTVLRRIQQIFQSEQHM